jgi:hypothetical protein
VKVIAIALKNGRINATTSSVQNNTQPTPGATPAGACRGQFNPVMFKGAKAVCSSRRTAHVESVSSVADLASEEADKVSMRRRKLGKRNEKADACG